MDKPIIIVFYVYADQPNCWRNTIQEQINDIKVCGILHVSDLYIHLSCSIDLKEAIKSYIDGQLSKLCHINYSYTSNNQFEYPALHQLYTLAQTNQNKIFVYFHTKDISHLDSTYKRSELNKTLTRSTLWNYNKVLNIFKMKPHINKIGLFPAQTQGWIWYNFFWVRGSFIATAKEPIISSDRWYYERWLHETDPLKSMTCFSMYTNDESYFAGTKAVELSGRIIATTDYLILPNSIDKITYGFQKKTTDVTKIVINWLKNDMHLHICNQNLQCDPYFGKVKELCFHFTDGHEMKFKEGRNLLIAWNDHNLPTKNHII